MPNDFTARSWPAACPLAVSPPLPCLLSLLLSLACFTHSQTAPYTLIYARTSCQNVFCCPRLQRFQFALTSRPGSQTLLPACLPDCQSVWPGLACSAVCLLEPITSAPCLPACLHNLPLLLGQTLLLSFGDKRTELASGVAIVTAFHCGTPFC